MQIKISLLVNALYMKYLLTILSFDSPVETLHCYQCNGANSVSSGFRPSPRQPYREGEPAGSRMLRARHVSWVFYFTCFFCHADMHKYFQFDMRKYIQIQNSTRLNSVFFFVY